MITLKALNDYIGLITAIVGLITIAAIIFSPIIALKIQKKIEKFNEKNQRGLSIFTTLLATRAEPASLEHVKALNLIDIEFYEEKKIRDSWNIYRDHLNSYPQNSDTSTQDRWEEKRVDYMTDLLYEMSNYFGYNFDKVMLKKGAYYPTAHGILNMEQALVRQGLVKLLLGQSSLKIDLQDHKVPEDQSNKNL
jgi:hypothetical protein